MTMNGGMLRRDSGSTLVTTAILSSVLFVISAAFLLLASSDYMLNRRSYRSSAALHLAEAGVEHTIASLPEDEEDTDAPLLTWEGAGTPSDPRRETVLSFTTSSGEAIGDFSVTVYELPGEDNTWIIESSGFVPGISAPNCIKRTVKVRAAPRKGFPFSEIFFGNQFLKLNGTVFTDSFDSRNGDYGGENVNSNGDIATNGSIIELDGGVVVNGDAATGPGGQIEGGGTVTGTVTHEMQREIGEIEVPSELSGLSYWEGDGLLTLTGSNTAILSAGDYKMRRIKLTAQAILSIYGPARIYLTGYVGQSILQTGSSTIVCYGRVDFYLDADASVGGNGVVNANGIPSDCRIWVSGGLPEAPIEVDLNGASDFYGTVYGSYANINLGGSGDAFGSFVGQNVACGGGSGYHYDEALGTIEVKLPGHSVAYWQEKE